LVEFTSEQLVYTASETIPDLERQIQQEENQLSILLGENPGPIARGRALTELPVPDAVPAGLPSELLERRPDVHQAEESIVAANAQVGVAKAAFFPSISLTGTGGLESNALNRFINAPSQTWYGAFSVAQPVFEGGALRSDSRERNIRRRCSLISRPCRTHSNRYRTHSSRLKKIASSASGRNCSLKHGGNPVGSRQTG
jgi:multidrug efflux system outer membrane protein